MARHHAYSQVKVDRLLEAMRLGHYMRHALALAGLSSSTVYRWLEEGRQENAPARMREFAMAVEEAEAQAAQAYLKSVHAARTDDPRLALDFLSRRFPAEYGKRETQQVQHEGTVRVELVWPEGPQVPE